jgi:hypothetical protein
MKRLISIVAVLVALAVLPLASRYVVAAPRSESASAITIADEDVRLFPNPVESELNVLCEKYDIERLMIFNSTGELVFNSPMPISQGSRITINLSSRPTGYYTIKVWAKGVKQPFTGRIFKV